MDGLKPVPFRRPPDRRWFESLGLLGYVTDPAYAYDVEEPEGRALAGPLAYRFFPAVEDLLATQSPSPQHPHTPAPWDRSAVRGSLPLLALIFVGSFFFLFLSMSLRPLVYDEGLILTAAMRVGAGQIPHRDFYANYGPAQFYLLAGLFKVFGPSVLIERLYDLLLKGMLVTAVYAITASFARRSAAACTAAVTLLWLFFLSDLTGTPVIPVSLLNVLSTGLLLALFHGAVSKKRLYAAGALAGLAALFRYDTGLALLAIDASLIAIALYFENPSGWLRRFGSTCGPYLLGFAVVTFLPVLFYLSVTPLHPIVFDILLYPGKYYHCSRNLPFPHVGLHTFENVQVYLPLLAVAIAFYAGFVERPGVRDPLRLPASRAKQLRGVLITFGLLALVMFFKGFVRTALAQMYLCIVPSFLVVAALFQMRSSLSRCLRWLVMAMVCVSALAVASATFHQAKGRYLSHLSVLEHWISPRWQNTPQVEVWCRIASPLTRGMCFLPEADQMQTIEFILANTTPGQTIYVGLLRHDKIFANNNLIYFAAQRLPATHWSHFDPGLQNNYDVQADMIRELDGKATPYVVLDSEFEYSREPNDSSRSSGVSLLDEYIRHRYHPVQTFGNFSIWRRTVPPAAG